MRVGLRPASGDGDVTRRGLRHRWRRLVDAAGTFAFTITLTLVITLIGALSATVWRGQHDAIKRNVGTDLGALEHVRLYRFLLSSFYQSKVGIDWRTVLFLLVLVGALEYMVGPARAAVTFFGSDIVASISALLVLALLGELGWHYAYTAARTADSGSSVGLFATAGAACVLLPGRWRALALAILGTFALPSFLWWSFATWLEHLIGTSAGVVLGARFWSRKARPLPPFT